MTPCITPPPDKKPRAPRRTSVLFASVNNGAYFWLPGRASTFVKTSFITAGGPTRKGGKTRVFINPFRSVLVKTAKGSPVVAAWIKMLEPAPFPANAGDTIRSGVTHFVGDACPGGHLNDGSKEVAEGWEREGGTTKEQNDARFPLPPNNDNNITGPTS